MKVVYLYCDICKKEKAKNYKIIIIPSSMSEDIVYMEKVDLCEEHCREMENCLKKFIK